MGRRISDGWNRAEAAGASRSDKRAGCFFMPTKRNGATDRRQNRNIFE